MTGPLLPRVSVRADAARRGWYWAVPAVGHVAREGLNLAPITVLIGDNGSGKSTLVEVIAAAWRAELPRELPHWSPPRGSDDADLHLALELSGSTPRPTGGCFLRAESMLGHLGGIDAAENLVRLVGGRLNARSHGESFLSYLETRNTGRGLWVLDEPEAALSFRSCLRLVSVLAGLAAQGSQVLLATHSPVLAALPDALILELGEDGMTSRNWAELELVRDWQDFLAAPERWLRHLF